MIVKTYNREGFLCLYGHPSIGFFVLNPKLSDLAILCKFGL